MMKTIINTILALTIVFFSINTEVQAQKKSKLFSGTIEYEITYSKADLDPATAAMLPTSQMVTVSGKKSRMDMNQGMMNIIKINNAELKSSVTLLDIMGQKYAIKTTKEEIEEALNSFTGIEVKVTDETKVIAGKTATKATVKYKDEDGEETSSEVYFCTEIGGENFNFDTPFNGVNGGLLQYTVTSNDMEMTFTAKEIKPKSIKDTFFMIPSDYQEVTAEELNNIFGGGGEF